MFSDLACCAKVPGEHRLILYRDQAEHLSTAGGHARHSMSNDADIVLRPLARLLLQPLGGYLIHPIYFSEFLQKFWITVIEANDLAKLGAVTCFVLDHFAQILTFP